MGIGKEQLLKQIEQHPGIDAARIGEAFNCDMDDIFALLADLVASGQVRMSNVESPNRGRKINGYSINHSLGWKAPKTSTIESAA